MQNKKKKISTHLQHKNSKWFLSIHGKTSATTLASSILSIAYWNKSTQYISLSHHTHSQHTNAYISRTDNDDEDDDTRYRDGIRTPLTPHTPTTRYVTFLTLPEKQNISTKQKQIDNAAEKPPTTTLYIELTLQHTPSNTQHFSG